jgi:hypothetical protein
MLEFAGRKLQAHIFILKDVEHLPSQETARPDLSPTCAGQ